VVGLVEDRDANVVEGHRLAFHQVQKPPGGRDEQVHAAVQGRELGGIGESARDELVPHADDVGQRLERVADLNREFAGRDQHEGAGPLGRGGATVGQPGERRQAERERLARPCAPAAENVTAGQRVGDRRRLDREGLRDPVPGEPPHQDLGQAEPQEGVVGADGRVHRRAVVRGVAPGRFLAPDPVRVRVGTVRPPGRAGLARSPLRRLVPAVGGLGAVVAPLVRRPVVAPLVRRPLAAVVTTLVRRPVVAPIRPTVITLIGRPVVAAVRRPVITLIGRPVVAAVRRPVVALIGRPVVTAIRRPVVALIGRPVVAPLRPTVIPLVGRPVVALIRLTVVALVRRPVVTAVRRTVIAPLRPTVIPLIGRPVVAAIRRTGIPPPILGGGRRRRARVRAVLTPQVLVARGLGRAAARRRTAAGGSGGAGSGLFGGRPARLAARGRGVAGLHRDP